MQASGVTTGSFPVKCIAGGHITTNLDASETNLSACDGYGIVDTGCRSCVAGTETLRRWQDVLRAAHGLEMETHESAMIFRYGNNQTLSATARRGVPCGLAGQNAKVFIHEVPGKAPFLVSLELLEAMGAILDTRNRTLLFSRTGRTVTLKRTRVGHLLIPMKDFAAEGYVETANPAITSDEVIVYSDEKEGHVSTWTEGEDDEFESVLEEVIEDLREGLNPEQAQIAGDLADILIHEVSSSAAVTTAMMDKINSIVVRHREAGAEDQIDS